MKQFFFVNIEFNDYPLKSVTNKQVFDLQKQIDFKTKTNEFYIEFKTEIKFKQEDGLI